MLASPLTSATPFTQNNRRLMQQAPTKVSGQSRVLCLRLERLANPGVQRKSLTPQALSEGFLKFSPRVQWRVDQGGSLWIFLDIASTSHLFGSEESLVAQAVSLAQDLGFGVPSRAVADTPAGAQGFAMIAADAAAIATIIPPGEERERLKYLSLPALLHLEGLQAWEHPSRVESIITFLMMLGFKTIGDASHLTISSFRERWGELGVQAWKRLHGQDRAPISPLLPTEPLEDYVHLDFPVSLVSLLLHQTGRSLDFIFARLEGRRLFARKLLVTLHCEYQSGGVHKIEIEPNTPSRDRDLFITLLENQLYDLDLANPIRDLEVHVVPCPEKSHQLDFFEPRETAQDKVQTLFSLLLQSALKPGFYKIDNAIQPDRTWSLVCEPQAEVTPAASTKLRALTVQTTNGAPAVAPTPEYGKAVMHSPRPTRILTEPVPLTIEELEDLKVLSHNPIERLESTWWEETTNSLSHRGREGPMARDYYFAISPEGQCLWIFQDLLSSEYFLHGYFD